MAGSPKPLTRWTQDTRIAFLLALRVHGTVREAAAAVGRSVDSAYKIRRRDAAFAADWAKVAAQVRAGRQAEAERARGDDPASPVGDTAVRIGRERCDGWDEGRRRRFLAMLGRGGSVAEACRLVGLSTTSAYLLRRRSPGFAAEWARALAERGLTPIEAAWQRAVEGWDEPVVFQGKVVAQRRRYSDAALRLLIQREDRLAAKAEARAEARGAAAARAAAEAAADGKRRAEAEAYGCRPAPARGARMRLPTEEETNRKIEELIVSLTARRRAEDIAFAERMIAEGKAP